MLISKSEISLIVCVPLFRFGNPDELYQHQMTEHAAATAAAAASNTDPLVLSQAIQAVLAQKTLTDIQKNNIQKVIRKKPERPIKPPPPPKQPRKSKYLRIDDLYVCEYCYKPFKKVNKLNIHRKIHTGE